MPENTPIAPRANETIEQILFIFNVISNIGCLSLSTTASTNFHFDLSTWDLSVLLIVLDNETVRRCIIFILKAAQLDIRPEIVTLDCQK